MLTPHSFRAKWNGVEESRRKALNGAIDPLLPFWSDAAGPPDFDRDNNMKLSPNDKIAGVLAPLFALRTEDDLGIGDVAALRQFIDWAALASSCNFRSAVQRRQQLTQLVPARSALPCTWLGGAEDLSKKLCEVTAGTDLSALPRGSEAGIVKRLKKLSSGLRRFPGTCPNRSAGRGSVRRIL
jgi:hypothetical protein